MLGALIKFNYTGVDGAGLTETILQTGGLSKTYVSCAKKKNIYYYYFLNV